MPVVATVSQARVLVEYRVLIEEPKSPNGKRTCGRGERARRDSNPQPSDP